MRRTRRVIDRRRQALPGHSRLTVPRAVAALRRSREAVAEVEGQLGALLRHLRAPDARIEANAPDRLTGATAQAGRALGELSQLLLVLP